MLAIGEVIPPSTNIVGEFLQTHHSYAITISLTSLHQIPLNNFLLIIMMSNVDNGKGHTMIIEVPFIQVEWQDEDT